VYAARVAWDETRADAVVNVGYRPTFGEDQYWIEAYVFDFSGDLYDRQLTVEFRARIRAERFSASRRSQQVSPTWMRRAPKPDPPPLLSLIGRFCRGLTNVMANSRGL
jgi:hypothetical protein